MSLRWLENEAIKMRQENGQIEFDTLGEIIKVSIGQFYGIEINDFAVSVAKTALWIAESQMMHETEEIVSKSFDILPLKSYVNIVEGNALRIDWNDVVSKNDVDFIMGNPPFVGKKEQTADLYDELTMPKELRKAHQNNDRAVVQAYRFSIKMIESECVGELMKMYRELMKFKY